MEFQRKGAASLGKSEAVGDMVIALLRLLRVAMSVKNPAGTEKASFGNIKIQISQLPIFGNGIIGGETDALKRKQESSPQGGAKK